VGTPEKTKATLAVDFVFSSFASMIRTVGFDNTRPLNSGLVLDESAEDQSQADSQSPWELHFAAA
jgi:hypothetical protein